MSLLRSFSVLLCMDSINIPLLTEWVCRDFVAHSNFVPRAMESSGQIDPLCGCVEFPICETGIAIQRAIACLSNSGVEADRSFYRMVGNTGENIPKVNKMALNSAISQQQPAGKAAPLASHPRMAPQTGTSCNPAHRTNPIPQQMVVEL